MIIPETAWGFGVDSETVASEVGEAKKEPSVSEHGDQPVPA
jgi:hypothetical protein